MNAKEKFRQKVHFSIVFLAVVMGVFLVGGTQPLFAEASAVEKTAQSGSSLQWALISAAVAFGFGAIGAGIAIANVGSAAMGAIGEKPEIASQALIFIALAEGLVVFGFIIALMILGKV